jgi:hypothetical protein
MEKIIETVHPLRTLLGCKAICLSFMGAVTTTAILKGWRS